MLVVGLFDAGVPNQERVVLKPNKKMSLVGYGILVGVDAGTAGAFPLFDNVFWFPDVVVEPPCWIYVYTGAGKMQQTLGPNNEPALVFHWQRPSVLFSEAVVAPVLVNIGSADIVPRITVPKPRLNSREDR
jgi:hypothetical protein